MVTPVPGWTLVWTNLGSSWPHLRTGQWRSRMRDLGRANAFPPRGTHLWGTGDCQGGEGWTACFRAGWRGSVTPRSALRPPVLGPGGPSQQVSFPVVGLSWVTGTHLCPSQRPWPPALRATRVAGRAHPPGRAGGAGACEEVPGMFSNFTM